jgi:superoxide reductase
MCNETKFFVCEHCGNFVGMINASGVNMVCCGDDMKEVEAKTADASTEKHVPVITVEDSLVKVDIGSVPHPMTPEHSIQWVYLETEQGGQRKCLSVDGEPHVEFSLTADDKVLAAYEYCNIHGLWKAVL